VPRYATLTDIAPLKIDAYQAEVEKDLDLAEQLWIRVLTAASGCDMDAIRALQRIERLRLERLKAPSPPSSLIEQNSSKRVPYYLPSFDQHIPRISPIRVKLPPSIEPSCLPSNINSGSLTDDLSSERGVDYTRLRDLVAAGKWKEADKETFAVMLKVSSREREGWLRDEDLKEFPCTDLHTINTLWVNHSMGHFGFSVQKRIWQSVGGTPNANYEVYSHFGKCVGWCEGARTPFGSWQYHNYDELTFELNAPEGHLPSGDVIYGLWRVRPYFGDNVFYGTLLSRRDL
jgi:hypothetical protein